MKKLYQYNIRNVENFNAIKKAEDDVAKIWFNLGARNTSSDRQTYKLFDYIIRGINMIGGDTACSVSGI